MVNYLLPTIWQRRGKLCKHTFGRPLKDRVKTNNKFAGEILATVIRSDIAESLHLGHLIVLNSDGSPYLSKGSPELRIFPRSAVKSLQASAMLKAGLTVSDEELAIICSCLLYTSDAADE